MAATKRNPPARTPSFGPRAPEPHPFLGMAFLILGVLVALAIGDYQPSQNPLFQSDIEQNNLIGQFGVKVAYAALYTLGLAAYVAPLLAFWLAYMFFRPYARSIGLRKLPPVILIFVSVAVFGAMYQVESHLAAATGPVPLALVADNLFPYGWGGWIGFWIYAQFLREFLGMVGSLVVFGVLSSFSTVFLVFDNLGRDLNDLFRVRLHIWAASREERARERAERKALKQAAALEKKRGALPTTAGTARQTCHGQERDRRTARRRHRARAPP